MKPNTDLEKAVDLLAALQACFAVTTDNRKLRACEGKVRYNKESARKAAIKMEDKKSEKFDVYECEYCGKYHIGHSRG